MPRSIYLGPAVPRWTPTSWDDIQAAVQSSHLDETHWVELKREVPTTKGSNAELARDLASFAVDGGLLVIGVEEDSLGRAQTVIGADLAGLAERVDAIARTRIDPPLIVRSHSPLEDPTRPGIGCLVVEIPPSASAPHMVDHVYYGRGDRAKIRLSDPQVREAVERRLLGHADLPALLDDLAETDPVPDHSDRTNGRLYFAVHPVAAREDALVELCTVRASEQLNNSLLRALSARGRSTFAPDLAVGVWRRQSDGITLTSGVRETGAVREDSLLELTVLENGGVHVLCGRGTSQAPSPWRAIGRDGTPRTYRVVLPALVLGLVHAALALAADLADRHMNYQGQWQIGLRLTGIKGAIPWEYVQNGDIEFAQPYNRDTYEHTTIAPGIELTDHADAVTERLVAPLLRGLGIDGRFLPYARQQPIQSTP